MLSSPHQGVPQLSTWGTPTQLGTGVGVQIPVCNSCFLSADKKQFVIRVFIGRYKTVCNSCFLSADKKLVIRDFYRPIKVGVQIPVCNSCF